MKPLRRGVQAELLLSLTLVMTTGICLLAVILLEIDQTRVEVLHGLLGRGLVAEVQAPGFELHPPEGGVWWRMDAQGRVTGINGPANTLDAGTRLLAGEALAHGELLIESGAPWAPIRFATPNRKGDGVVMGRIDAPISGLVLAAVVVCDVMVFGLFGVTLLRKRIVGPLHRLADSVREVGLADLPACVPVEGVGEIQELGQAFNEMQTALASRTGALEKAVLELRTTNANLVQAREGLDRAERLAMVGSLAAGVAHEVGNPMGALLAFLDLAGRDPGLGEAGRRSLDRASEQGERVRVILRQLLDFSRPPRVEHGPVALDAVAHQVIQLVSAQPEFSDIEFEVKVEPGIRNALGDESLVSQILLNLALNAAASMRDCAQRKIRFEIARTVRHRRAGEIGEDAASFRADSIVCRIADSGPGVELDDPERIFDPFFTTKAPGEGTGLGLANARRLAGEMGGTLELDRSRSEWGGAVFCFLLSEETDESRDSDVLRAEAAHQSRRP